MNPIYDSFSFLRKVGSWFTSHPYLFIFFLDFFLSTLLFQKVSGLLASPNCALQNMCPKIAEKYIKYLINKRGLIKWQMLYMILHNR